MLREISAKWRRRTAMRGRRRSAFNRKDFEVYGEHGYAVASGGNALRVRLTGSQEKTQMPSSLPTGLRDSISYLRAIVRGDLKPSGLSSLENNMIVTEILEAARE